MSLRVVVAFFLFNSIFVFSQEKIIKHTVVKGETISSIAAQYEVKQSVIYKLNPKAKNLLKLSSVLLIPIVSLKNTSPKAFIAEKQITKEHEVLQKQTSYGIAKQYGISLLELNQANPELEQTGLKIGQKINIPILPTTTKELVDQPKRAVLTPEVMRSSAEVEKQILETSTRLVLSKETKYSIAKQYGISIADLEKANPALVGQTLQVGQRITIPGAPVVNNLAAVILQDGGTTPVMGSQSNIRATPVPEIVEEIVLQPKKEATVAASNQGDNNDLPIVFREVMPKETKYSIAKEYGITVAELERQNPKVKRKLLVGHKLTIYPKILSSNNSSVTDIGKNNISQAKPEENQFTKPVFNPDFLDELIEYASENIGTRYQIGGTTKSGFDCSGLMCTTFEAIDVKLPRTSIGQSSIGTKINTDEAKKGDLIFFKTNGRRQINHVGMVVEVCEGEIRFIHASVSNGVIISSTKEKYYEKNFTQINRVLQ